MTTAHRPRGLNHVAYVTRDTAATRRFYTEVLGMPLVGSARDDAVGSTGEASSFLHTFFEMADGSCVAFFEIEGLDADHSESSLPRWAPHLAMSADSREQLEAVRDRLLAEGVEVRGIIEHEDTWSSIYFFDPNGVRLELTHQYRPLDGADAAAADRAVATWVAEHAEAGR